MSRDWFDSLRRSPLRLPASVRAANGGAQLLAVLEEYQRTERLSPAELALQQGMLLDALAKHSAEQSPHFAVRLKKAGLTPDTLAEPGGLARLPPLTRRELNDAGEAMFCRSYPPAHGRFSLTSTSGSTGEPVTLRRTEMCQMHWMAYTMREHLWHGRDFSGRLAISRANVAEAAESPDWGPPCSLLVRTGPASAMPATSSVEELVRWLVDFKPDYFLMLPSNLAGVVTEFERTGQRLDGLRGIRSISETLSPQLREAVRRVLGVEIQDTYSSQEGGIMATQCPEGGAYHVSETIIMEIVDAAGRPCAPGQVGRILVTDLLNYSTPLVRYEIGDFAEVGGPCPCGRGLSAIRRFLGRERNLVLWPDGTRHWPTVGFHRWDEAYPVRQFQFIQTGRDTVTARMSATGRPSPEQEAILTKIIQEALGYPFAILYEWQEAPLPRGPGGKFEEFICRVK